MLVTNKYTQSRIMRKAEAAFEVSRIVAFLFWMPIFVLTFLSFFLN